MEFTVLTLSSAIYVVVMLLLLGAYPNWFVPNPSGEGRTNQDRCFISFFLAGFIAVIIHHLVSRSA